MHFWDTVKSVRQKVDMARMGWVTYILPDKNFYRNQDQNCLPSR